MALVNHAKKEINAKLVYFGPPGAGKKASITAVYRKLKANCRGELKSMAVQDSTMLFFDFVPPGQDAPSGFRVRFHVYTLAGEVASPSHWNLLLKGADGVVFVADSTDGRLDDNRKSLQLLEEGLRGFGTGLTTIPCVLQYNKRDTESALSMTDLERSLNPGGLPAFPSSADRGEGVVDVLARLVRTVMKRLHDSEPDTVGEDIRIYREEASQAVSFPQETSPPGRLHAAVEQASPSQETVATADSTAISFVGEPLIVAADRVRIPLTINCNGQEKRLTVTVAVSFEES